jgi:hypothetical protein
MAETPKPSATPVVGRKPVVPKFNPLPSITPTPTPSQSAAPSISAIDKINQKLGLLPGFPAVDPNAFSGLNTNDNYTNEEATALGLALKKLGYPVKKTRESVLTVISTNPELLALQAKSKTYSDFLIGLKSAYLPGLDTPATPKAPDTTRQVYQYKPEEINALIDDVYTTTLGRPATEQEKQAKFAVLNEQIKQGTTSTSKVVKNPKTGKMETLVTQTPAFSTAAAKTSIESELKKANPDDFDRKKRIDFAGWLSQNVAGA